MGNTEDFGSLGEVVAYNLAEVMKGPQSYLMHITWICVMSHSLQGELPMQKGIQSTGDLNVRIIVLTTRYY